MVIAKIAKGVKSLVTGKRKRIIKRQQSRITQRLGDLKRTTSGSRLGRNTKRVLKSRQHRQIRKTAAILPPSRTVDPTRATNLFPYLKLDTKFDHPNTTRPVRALFQYEVPLSKQLTRSPLRKGQSLGKYGGMSLGAPRIGALGSRADYLKHVRKIRLTKRQRKENKMIDDATDDWTRAFYSN